jgi:hypothetical protein
MLRKKKKYGILNFISDVVSLPVTVALWLIDAI